MGEGPGHLRDTDLALLESGIGEAIDSAKLPFADLNYQEVARTPNRGRSSRLDYFYFPQAVAEADLIVSLPKMKTHHWVGVTASTIGHATSSKVRGRRATRSIPHAGK